ncbi:Acylphosphatase [Giardia duodenalis]|nr:Acylphosphatase [Giardia intestinalis]
MMQGSMPSSSEDVTTLCYRVTGKVQGVFFRKYTKKEADALSLVGYVTNNEDGSVSGVVQGPKEQVDAFVKYLHKGSPKSVVKKVSIHASSRVDADGFEIRR